MLHDGCDGIAGKAELLIGIESTSSRQVRKIVLITNPMLHGRPRSGGAERLRGNP